MKIGDYTHDEKQNALDEAWDIVNKETETNAARLYVIKDKHKRRIRLSTEAIDHLIEQAERVQESKSELERLKEKERIYQLGDEWYRKKTEPIKHLWPLENWPGIGQIVEKFQSQLEEKERLREALEDLKRSLSAEYAGAINKGVKHSLGNAIDRAIKGDKE